MSEPKGPKLDLPDDLVESIDDEEEASDDEEIEVTTTGDHGDDGDDPPAGEESSASGDEVAAWKDRHLRLAAEFENFKRRALKERQDLLNFGTENLIKELLATIDNMERALGHVSQEEEVDKENLLEGVAAFFEKREPDWKGR